jgi:hypothetical protein
VKTAQVDKLYKIIISDTEKIGISSTGVKWATVDIWITMVSKIKMIPIKGANIAVE